MLSVILPAYNEAEILAATVDDLHAGLTARGSFEIVVVENGSTDATPRIAADLASRYPEVRVLTRARADYGAALRAGLLAADGDVSAVFNVDCYDLAFLDAALAVVDRGEGDGPALVVGSKRAPGSHDERPLTRRLGTEMFARLLRAGFGLRISDTHGMKVLATRALRPVVGRCTFGHDLFDTELVVRAERAGVPLGELPVSVAESRPARTPFLGRVPRTLVGLVRLHRALRAADLQPTSAGTPT